MLLHDELRQFVTDNFMFGKPYEGFADDDSFIERGIIDSTAVMELMAFLEAHYRIKLQDPELIPDNFDSINKLARFVESRLQPNDTEDRDVDPVVLGANCRVIVGKNGLASDDRRITCGELQAMHGTDVFSEPLTSEQKR
jgi:acyl carrier protein